MHLRFGSKGFHWQHGWTDLGELDRAAEVGHVHEERLIVQREPLNQRLNRLFRLHSERCVLPVNPFRL